MNITIYFPVNDSTVVTVLEKGVLFGVQGAQGVGVPTGGVKDYILSKKSNADFDFDWVPNSGGGGGAVNSVNGKTGVVVLVKGDIGLGSVDNTSDANKPVSTAQQTALNLKENTITAGTTAQYYRGDKIFQTLDKAAVGLGNVDNTSDVNKPISSATQTALDGKVDKNTAITGATKTKITYDSKGLVTAGADATTVDIADSSNKRYVTDAQLVVIANTSGTNTGDNATNSQYSGLAASKQDVLGFTPENVANKSTSVDTDQASNTKYPSVKAVYDWAVGLFATISNLALKTDKKVVRNRQTASYTLVVGDKDKLVEMNVASANNLTVPASIFADGDQILLAQYGAGQTTVVAGSGMTIRSNGGKLKLNVQYSGASLVFVSATEAYLFGDIA
jgi:hypothetical protein